MRGRILSELVEGILKSFPGIKIEVISRPCRDRFTCSRGGLIKWSEVGEPLVTGKTGELDDVIVVSGVSMIFYKEFCDIFFEFSQLFVEFDV